MDGSDLEAWQLETSATVAPGDAHARDLGTSKTVPVSADDETPPHPGAVHTVTVIPYNNSKWSGRASADNAKMVIDKAEVVIDRRPPPAADANAPEDKVVVGDSLEGAPVMELGRVLGERYQLDHQTGVGGFGAVFAARDLRLNKRVAVKVLSPRVAERDDMLTRFRREAIAASRIGHEGIVDVTDFDRDADGTHFIVMEFLHGSDLANLLDHEKRLAPVRALSIAAQVGNALYAAHLKRIVHRDLKPSNIYLVERQSRHDAVKIIDFGISKILAHSIAPTSVTRQGAILGTPYYMAPEQAAPSGELDHRVDIYALGVILFQMLTGQRPFTGKSYLSVLDQQRNKARPKPSDVYPELRELPIADALDALVVKAMAKDAEARHSSMIVMVRDIVAALEVLDATAADVVRPVRPPRRATGDAPVIDHTEPGLGDGELLDEDRTVRYGPTEKPSADGKGPLKQEGTETELLSRLVVERAEAQAAPTEERTRRSWLGIGVAAAVVAAAVIAFVATRGNRPASANGDKQTHAEQAAAAKAEAAKRAAAAAKAAAAGQAAAAANKAKAAASKGAGSASKAAGSASNGALETDAAAAAKAGADEPGIASGGSAKGTAKPRTAKRQREPKHVPKGKPRRKPRRKKVIRRARAAHPSKPPKTKRPPSKRKASDIAREW
ncbi:MAG: serine/threonine protein kinase [Myxococcales bacterium]|nr:serine/threonine protein kinase [Myxococcales bacterium]